MARTKSSAAAVSAHEDPSPNTVAPADVDPETILCPLFCDSDKPVYAKDISRIRVQRVLGRVRGLVRKKKVRLPPDWEPNLYTLSEDELWNAILEADPEATAGDFYVDSLSWQNRVLPGGHTVFLGDEEDERVDGEDGPQEPEEEPQPAPRGAPYAMFNHNGQPILGPHVVPLASVPPDDGQPPVVSVKGPNGENYLAVRGLTPEKQVDFMFGQKTIEDMKEAARKREEEVAKRDEEMRKREQDLRDRELAAISAAATKAVDPGAQPSPVELAISLFDKFISKIPQPVAPLPPPPPPVAAPFEATQREKLHEERAAFWSEQVQKKDREIDTLRTEKNREIEELRTEKRRQLAETEAAWRERLEAVEDGLRKRVGELERELHEMRRENLELTKAKVEAEAEAEVAEATAQNAAAANAAAQQRRGDEEEEDDETPANAAPPAWVQGLISVAQPYLPKILERLSGSAPAPAVAQQPVPQQIPPDAAS
jgi:hypothetical protein